MKTILTFIKSYLFKNPLLLKVAMHIWKTFVKSAFKLRYPTVRYLQIKQLEKMSHFSQFGQDGYIYDTFFKNKKDGVFCDIGGNHPIDINNTYYFEQQGWQGYVFEPLPHMKKIWQNKRTAKFFPYAASSEQKQLQFEIMTTGNGALSYVTDTLSHHIPTDADCKTITVQARPAKDIFKTHKITHIDYMSIDVEGHEIEVLKGLDFNTVRINVISIENNPSLHIWGDLDIRQILLDNGFVFYARIPMLDDIYVHADFLNHIQTTY